MSTDVSSAAGDPIVGAATFKTELSIWLQAMDTRLEEGYAERVAPLAQVVLTRFPHHLSSYQRLLQAAWQLKRWQEGEEWGRRLLQADPGNPLAWRALAYADEQRRLRASANALWLRAFESSPYDQEIRSGLHRTSLDPANALMLDGACLAALYFRGCRWQYAAAAYRALMAADPRRSDFQLFLAVSLWQLNAKPEAYRIARDLTAQHPHMLMAWVVVNALGDVDDRALARNPLASLDPDGDFVRNWLGLPYEGRKSSFDVTEREAALLPARFGELASQAQGVQ